MSTRLPVGKGSRTRTAKRLRALAHDMRNAADSLDDCAQRLQEGHDTAWVASQIDGTLSLLGACARQAWPKAPVVKASGRR